MTVVELRRFLLGALMGFLELHPDFFKIRMFDLP